MPTQAEAEGKGAVSLDGRLIDLCDQFGRSEVVLGLDQAFPPNCQGAMTARRIVANCIAASPAQPQGGAA